MFFALKAEKAYLSDLNKPLINFYNWLKLDPDTLHTMSSSWDRSKDVYLNIRAKFDTDADDLENAARFFYLNCNCFNGIYRTNRSNKYNVPFAGDRMAKTPSLNEVKYFSHRLKSVDFSCRDFRQAIQINLGPQNFFYIDPPYFVDDRRVFLEYGPQYFSKEDLFDLSDLLDDIDRSGGKFMVSYADCTTARQVFLKWQIDCISLTRNVGGFKKTRRRADELVIRNYQ